MTDANESIKECIKLLKETESILREVYDKEIKEVFEKKQLELIIDNEINHNNGEDND